MRLLKLTQNTQEDQMVKVKEKYGFPLFTKQTSIVNLGKNEKLVISDIWAFWDYVIKKAAKDKKGEDFLRSLLEQAKHFYISAEGSPVKSQPLLYYYSFLNLSKIMINLTGTFGPSRMYMHGIKEDHKHKFINSEIVKLQQKHSIVQVAHEIVSLFDSTISTGNVTLKVKEMLNHCVGVHRAYSEIYNQPEIFVRIKSTELLKEGKRLIFKAYLQCEADKIAELTACGYNILTDEGIIYYEETYNMSSYSPTRLDYAALSEVKVYGILLVTMAIPCIYLHALMIDIVKNLLYT